MEVLANVEGWHWLGLSVLSWFCSLLVWRGVLLPLATASFGVAVLLAIVYVPIYHQLSYAAGFLALALVWHSLHDRKRLPPQATERILRRRRLLSGQKASILSLQTQKQGRIQLQDAIWTVESDKPVRVGELVEVTRRVRGGALAVTPAGKEATPRP